MEERFLILLRPWWTDLLVAQTEGEEIACKNTIFPGGRRKKEQRREEEGEKAGELAEGSML